jgi:aminopeptidase N
MEMVYQNTIGQLKWYIWGSLYNHSTMRPVILLSFLLFHKLILGQADMAVDFTKINVEIKPFFNTKEVRGKGTYDFTLSAPKDSIFLDAVNITFLDVTLNGRKIKYTNSDQKLGFKAPANMGRHQLFLNYMAKPKQTVYFVTTTPYGSHFNVQDGLERKSDGQAQKQIWTQGQGKYTSHWLPSFDDMTEKVEFDVTLKIDKGLEAISNGQLREKTLHDGLVEWKFDMLSPMSSYLVAFVIGDFDKKVLTSKSGVPIMLYYNPKDSARVEPTYRYTKAIFDFLEEEIGVAYPWQNYKQVPVHDFLYAGMENTTATVFSDSFVIDSTAFVDLNYVNVNAHEMAHQWFGNLVTEKNGEHHWLHEGFATYYAYLAEKALIGEDHFYWKLHRTAVLLRDRSNRGEGEALTDRKANSTTFYEKGAWALTMLRNKVGEKTFKTGIRAFLMHYAYSNATIDDFLTEMEVASGRDLAQFKETWLSSTTFPWEKVKTWLMQKNSSIHSFHTQGPEKLDLRDLGKNSSVPYILAVMERDRERFTGPALLSFLKSGDPMVRQKAVQLLDSITDTTKSTLESLLVDDSYVTNELALYKLWANYPEERNSYLDRTHGIMGLPNKNVRLLWLTLAMITPGYNTESKSAYFNELSQYTSPVYNADVRMGAFQYLNEIKALNDSALLNLIRATTHHSWQCRNFARGLLTQLLQNEKERNKIKMLSKELEDNELSFLKTKIGAL